MLWEGLAVELLDTRAVLDQTEDLLRVGVLLSEGLMEVDSLGVLVVESEGGMETVGLEERVPRLLPDPVRVPVDVLLCEGEAERVEAADSVPVPAIEGAPVTEALPEMLSELDTLPLTESVAEGELLFVPTLLHEPPGDPD